jgi:hypothetical protein
MQSKPFIAWKEGLVINLVSNAIGFFAGVLVAYLKHEGSEWVSPLLYGALAWILTMGIFLVVRLFRNIPARQVRITDRNLSAILRGWIDDIGLKVQIKKEDDLTHFTFIVTTDGNWVISIMRLKATPEYLTFTGYYKDDAQNFSHFTDEEKIEARLAIRLELSRAVMGFTSADLLDGFTLFRRIPISPQLNIEEVSRTLWEVEAALASVFSTGAILLARKKNGNLLLYGGTNEA